MSVVITCAVDEKWSDFIQSRLSSWGLASAVPEQRTGLTAAEFSEKLSQVYDSQSDPEHLQVGRAWQITAAELFLSNARHKQWGWAHSKNADFLSFWNEFDNDSKFILTYPSPHDFPGVLTVGSLKSPEYRQTQLELWRRYCERLIKFYWAHSDKCVLVNQNWFRDDFENIASLLEQKLHLDLSPRPLQAVREHSSVSELIRKHVLILDEPSKVLYDELRETSDLGPDLAAVNNSEHYTHSITDEWEHISEKVNIADSAKLVADELELELKSVQNENEQFKIQNEILQNQYNLMRKDNISLATRRQLEAENRLLSRSIERTVGDQRVLELENQNLKLELHSTKDKLVLQSTEDVDKTQFVPQNLDLDLRTSISGEGWYPPEDLGRWAGSSTHSSLRVGRLEAAPYCVAFRIVDAMSEDVIANLSLTFNSHRIPHRVTILSDMGGRLAPVRRLKHRLARTFPVFPIIVAGKIPAALVDSVKNENTLGLSSPVSISPAEFGKSDSRKLSVCVSNLTMQRS